MANFGQLILTNVGIQLQYKAQAGEPLKFKRIAMGSGNYSGNIMALTKLINENVSVDISKGYIQNNAYVVEGFFSNESLNTGFAWREIGLFAEDTNGNEVLYCYANAGDTYDYIPATEDERYSKYIRILTAIGNATNVTIVENGSVTYVDRVTFDTTVEELRTDIYHLWPSYSSSGIPIFIDDSANQPFVGMNIYGKSTQDGIPSPDAPIDIVSVGNNGSVEVGVYGKNVLAYPYKETTITKNGLTFTDNGDGSITVNGTATNTTYFSLSDIPQFDGEFIASGCPKNGTWATYQISIDKNGLNLANDYGNGVSVECNKSDIYSLAIVIRKDVTVSKLIFYPQVEIKNNKNTATEYEGYKEKQNITISTPNGLHGIPVSSGGNYTDKFGQQWICDEIDLARGVYIKRLNKILLGTSAGWTKGAEDQQTENTTLFYCYPTGKAKGATNFMCDSFPVRNVLTASNDFIGIFGSVATQLLYVRVEGQYTLEEFKEWVGEHPITGVYQITTPIETALTNEEIKAYRALVTNNPNTTITNNANANMDVEYVKRTYDALLKEVIYYMMPNAEETAVAAISADGVSYTATVEGLTELLDGKRIVIIPNRNNTSTKTTLNVNGLGNASIMRRIPPTNTLVPADIDLLTANRPYLLMYATVGTPCWIVEDMPKPSAEDLYGVVPIENGGSNIDSSTIQELATALENEEITEEEYTAGLQKAAQKALGLDDGVVVDIKTYAGANADKLSLTFNVVPEIVFFIPHIQTETTSLAMSGFAIPASGYAETFNQQIKNGNVTDMWRASVTMSGKTITVTATLGTGPAYSFNWLHTTYTAVAFGRRG